LVEYELGLTVNAAGPETEYTNQSWKIIRENESMEKAAKELDFMQAAYVMILKITRTTYLILLFFKI
jgi:hypothetical protein